MLARNKKREGAKIFLMKTANLPTNLLARYRCYLHAFRVEQVD
jgi:hypothetical protein